MAGKQETFRLRRNLSIGSLTAELDHQLLERCFVETEAYEAVASPENSACIILGRSGSGKSAIIRHIVASGRFRTIDINPQQLALQFLGGSELLRALRDTGVHLDLFYKLVWRHVFVVELIKTIFP